MHMAASAAQRHQKVEFGNSVAKARIWQRRELGKFLIILVGAVRFELTTTGTP